MDIYLKSELFKPVLFDVLFTALHLGLDRPNFVLYCFGVAREVPLHGLLYSVNHNLVL